MKYGKWKKRASVLMAAAMAVNGLPVSAITAKAAEAPDSVTAMFGTPFVDGEMDDVWNTAPAYALEQPDVREDAQATVRLLWDDNALYVYAEVLDDNLSKDSGNAYEHDSIEVFLDELYDRANTYQDDDVHYRVNFANDRSADNGDSGRWYTATKTFERPVSVEAVDMFSGDTVSGDTVSGDTVSGDAVSEAAVLANREPVTEKGYIVEACLRFDKITPQNGTELGFDAQVNAATGASRQGTINLFDKTGNAYQNPTLLGKLVLSGKSAGASSGAFPYSLISYLEDAKKINLSVYTERSAEVLQEAIANAEALLNSGSYTQEQIDEAYEAIKEAINGLDDGSGYTSPYDMVADPTIPNIFTMKDGTAVTADNWSQRAEEITKLYEYYMYGVKPDTEGETVTYEIGALTEKTQSVTMPDGSNKDVNVKQGNMTVKINYDGKDVSFDTIVTLPTVEAPDANGYPVFTEIAMSFWGGVSASNNAYYAASRGYAAITYDYLAITSDDSKREGIFYTLHPYGDSWEEQSGKLVAWGWGASKILDALYGGAAAELKINPDNNILSGVSRLGKTTAVAGAYDKRIKVVAPSCSGYGGLAMYRYRTEGKYYDLTELGGSSNYYNDGNETLGSLQADGERGWFNDNFMKFDDMTKFPVDQHYLASLVADPNRYLFMITGVTSENWNGAESQTLTYAAAKQVFDMLGAGDNINICTHLDGHSVEVSDMQYLLDYCDVKLYNKSENDIDSDLREIKTNVFLNEANYKEEVFGPYIESRNEVTSVNVERTTDMVTVVRAGASVEEIKEQLPTAILYLDSGLRHLNVAVDWDLSAYDQTARSAQELTLTGTAVLPEGVTNPNNLSLTATTKLVVNVYSVEYGSVIADAAAEAAWDNAVSVKAGNLLDGPSESGGTADIKVMWDEAYLYLLADVSDSNVYVKKGANENQDSLAVTIAQSIDSGKSVKNYVFTAGGEALSHTISFSMWGGLQNTYEEVAGAFAAAKINETTSWWSTTVTGWTLEACISWEELGMTPGEGTSIAIEAIVNNCSASTVDGAETVQVDNRHAISLTSYPENIEEGQAFDWNTWGTVTVEYNAGLYAKDLTTFTLGSKGDVTTVAEDIGRYDLVKYIDAFKETYVEPYPIKDSFDESKLTDARAYALDAAATKEGIAEKKAELEAMAEQILKDNCYGKMMTKYGTPLVDGLADDELWDSAYAYYTDKDSKGQYAEIKTLWDEEALYALVKVYDSSYDVTGSDAHTKDSVEFFLLESADAANNSFGKNGGQWRINRANQTTVTFGSNEAFYAKLTEMADGAGYIVEARLDFADSITAAKDYVMNFDVAVNLCENGNRTSAVAWTSTDCYSNPKTAGEIILLETAAEGTAQVENGYNPYALIKVLDKALVMDVSDYDAASFNANYDKAMLQEYYNEAMAGSLTAAQIEEYYNKVIAMMSKITYDGVHKSALGFEANHNLPDAFTFEDGSKVQNNDDWALRHDEIQDLYEFYMYGKLPKADETGLTKSFSVNEAGDTYTVTTSREINGKKVEGSFSFKVYMPEGTPRDEKGWPYIINYGGNISGAQDAGYAVIDYSGNNDVAANNSYYQGLFYTMYPECRGDEYATGVGPLAARAWGAGLIIDCIEEGIGSLDRLNPANSVVTGFSYLGKTALVTGVLEERIAVTNPAHSGIGGAAMLRYSSQGKAYTADEYGFDQLVDKTEPIGQVQGQGMSWVKTIFADFVGADSTPFDTHLLLSLVAPRGLYVSAGYKDNGTDPEGMYASYVNAREVYEFLGAEGSIAYGNFPTAHQTSDAEWQSLFTFCDYYFYRDALDGDFYATVYDNSPDKAEYMQTQAPRNETVPPADYSGAVEALDKLGNVSMENKIEAVDVVLDKIKNQSAAMSSSDIQKLEEKISDILGKKLVLDVAAGAPAVETVTGALLSVGAGEEAVIKVTLAAMPAIPKGYKNAKAFDIKLYAGSAQKQLVVPVRIKMHIPDGVDAKGTIKLLHYGEGSTTPEILDVTVDGTSIIFTADKFSTYVIVNVDAGDKEPEKEPEESNNGNHSGSGNSTSASPEAEKVTVWIEYIVTRGDTLYRIAARNNMPLSKLLALNPQIKNPNRIYPGQKIILGQTTVAVTDPAATAKNAVYYTVVRGDSLFKIARKTSLKLNQLIAMNMDIARQKYIYAGQRVRVR